MAKDELWSGISIMTPEEMESSVEGEDTTVENNDEGTVNTVKTDSPEIITPSSEEKGSDFDIDDKGNFTVPEFDENSGPEDHETQLSRYGALIKDLQDDGILTGLEGEELEEKLQNASKDTLKELMEQTVEKAFKNKEKKWKNSFSGSKKKFLEIEDSFDNVDHAIQMAQRLDYLDTLDDDSIRENESLQKQLYAESLRSRGFSDQEIIEFIEEAEAIDGLESKAMRALPQLRKEANDVVAESKKEKELKQAELARNNEEQYNKLMASIDEREEFIPGLKINKAIRDKIKQNIVTPIAKDKNGKDLTSLMYKQNKNPLEFQMLINYYDSIGLFNIEKGGKFKPDISKLKNVAKTQAVGELDKVLMREERQGVGRGNTYKTSDRTDSVLGLLESAYGKKRK